MRPGKGSPCVASSQVRDRPLPTRAGGGLRGTEDAGGTLGDRLADPVAEDDYERVSAPDRNRVRALLKALDARERTIVKARFGLDGPERTLRQFGVTLGVSASACAKSSGTLSTSSERRPSPARLADPRPVVPPPRSADQDRTTKGRNARNRGHLTDPPCELSSDRREPLSSRHPGGRLERRTSLRGAGAGRPSPLCPDTTAVAVESVRDLGAQPVPTSPWSSWRRRRGAPSPRAKDPMSAQGSPWCSRRRGTVRSVQACGRVLGFESSSQLRGVAAGARGRARTE